MRALEDGWSRRGLLAAGLCGAAAVAVGAVGLELVSHGVLPGEQALDQLDGDCSVGGPALRYLDVGASTSGAFYSKARNREVGYTIGLPPGYKDGDLLPLIVMLHGYGGNHRSALSGMTPAEAMALEVEGKPLPPMAMVTVDGGGGYWNPHPADNPMAMITDELVPMCQKLGLGHPTRKIATMGISMGGFGAILLAERYPELFSAVAAISPAIWTSYGQARAANPGAFASVADFDSDNVVTHADALSETPVRIASGISDPFHPGVVALADALPPGKTVVISKGCHTGPFFEQQEPLSLAFLAKHLPA